MFEIDHLRNEHLESVDGYYAEPVGITALQFKTNFRTSELFGFKEKGTKFTLAVTGKKIIGLHGSDRSHVCSLGAYLTWITPIRLDEKGRKGGKEWDDGSDHDNVSKIHVRGGFEGIQFIKFDYVKDRKVLENGSTHGVSSRGFTQTFEINHRNDEYLVSVEGYYYDVSGVIQGLQFKTNMQTFDIMGYEKGRKFTLEASGYKIIGFHGYAGKNLNSLGVYFTTQTPNKLKCQGLTKGLFWDDGSNNDGIRKVYVDDTRDWNIKCIRLEYVNNGKVEKTHRRYYVENEKEFVLDYPNELITSVEGTMSTDSDTDIRSLTIKTVRVLTS
ncbi:PREDICTED: jacalin-related lectin 43-like [Camelina sativa]|uniref:Jacalin-related lectin 43-like n=1 Tax=Camelina sativa TaxID=90675 RepID=A0ABM1RKE9_CAMSA|nr:PREDICTED: jacalin-related lectin 43-like [Camelina sativa]